MQSNLNILIADDHPLFRDALANAIGDIAKDSTITLAEDFSQAIEHINNLDMFDFLLLDLNMPGSEGLSGLTRLRAEFPALPVVVVSAMEDAAIIRRSISLGAAGYITKSSSVDELRSSLELVIAGELCIPKGIDLTQENDPEEADLMKKMLSLTPQQHRVLGMLGEGLLNKQIAYELNVSEATIKAHVSAILLKLEVDSRTQAVIVLGKLSNPADVLRMDAKA